MRTYEVQWFDGNQGGAVSDWPEHIRKITVGDNDTDKTAINVFRHSMKNHGTWLLADCWLASRTMFDENEIESLAIERR